MKSRNQPIDDRLAGLLHHAPMMQNNARRSNKIKRLESSPETPGERDPPPTQALLWGQLIQKRRPFQAISLTYAPPLFLQNRSDSGWRAGKV
jgi:hypothetical protein